MSGIDTSAILVFLLSVTVLVGLAFAILILVLKARKRHGRRLSRVSRKRQAGLDIEDSRLSLLRQKTEANAFVAFSNAMARVIPLMDTARLRHNIGRAGMNLSVSGFVLASLSMAAILAVAASFITGRPIYITAVPGLLAGMFLMDALVTFRGEMTATRFMTQLPDAIDAVIRGIRSGLPVTECIGTIGQEFDRPLGPYFRTISERVQLGETLDSGLWRVARVIARPEMDFFAISISIQMETGGSLSEALGNLADLLRQRERLKLKIKAISSEARASALIIGALPFVMLGILATMSPDYVAPLFTDPRGHMMLGAGLGSISMGAFVMWRMTKFEV